MCEVNACLDLEGVSPYRFGAVDRLVKKNMPGRLFFVIAFRTVPT